MKWLDLKVKQNAKELLRRACYSRPEQTMSFHRGESCKATNGPIGPNKGPRKRYPVTKLRKWVSLTASKSPLKRASLPKAVS